ncbi:uncharacterized protein LOC105696127 [Orussus abietinus]|uniref:uncharacterized protein LOC105696127 n=1 Tax=Orussus abietinus TaxID=222816 RepID=UPI0006256489|nr:uncharacterized protein LOC105696127 [Orussus abietinus]
MAGSRLAYSCFALFCNLFFAKALSNPVNVPLESVSDSLVQSALNALNKDSPTDHTYNGGNLISAQRLIQPPYVIYRLTLNLDPICKEDSISCPREACAIDLRQHEGKVIEVLHHSIQCMYLYPQFAQDEAQSVQDSNHEANTQDQEIIDRLDKQIVNQSIELDHEVQSTADQSDRPFIAVRASSTNYCPGCPYELNPTLLGLTAFGEQVLHSMDELSHGDFKHKLISIVRVTRTVPPSSNVVQYELLLEIGESNCLKTILIERSECALQPNIPIKLCLVTFDERPWQDNSRRITRNNCTDTLDSENEININLSQSSTGGAVALGDPKEHTNQEEFQTEQYDQVAQEGKVIAYGLLDATLMSSTNDSNTQPIYTGIPITEEPFVKVTVDGENKPEKVEEFTDKMKEFDAFLEDFDIGIKIGSPDPTVSVVPDMKIITERIEKSEVNSDSKDDKPDVKESNGVTQNVENVQSTSNENSYPSVSGLVEPNILRTSQDSISVQRERRSLENTPESEGTLVTDLAEKAINILDDMDSDNNKRVLLEILDSVKQTRKGGTMYHLTLKVASTKCDEAQTQLKDCLKNFVGPMSVCKIQVLVESDGDRALEKAKVLQSKCKELKQDNTRAKRENAVGAPHGISKDDPEVQRFANLGLVKFSEISESSNEPILVEVLEATRQIVAGSLYKIKVKLGTSNCPKGTKENCQLNESAEVKECLVTVWSRPWIDQGIPDIKVDCDPLKSKTKRSLRGQNYTQKMAQIALELRHETMFEDFMKSYDRVYKTDEEKNQRFEVFKDNLKIIDYLQQNEQGSAQYGVTMFADLTPEEFRARYLGLRPDLRSENQIPMPMAKISNIKLPVEFDWRHYNVVTPVKDQGQCGSCWAFSVTGNIEGQFALRHKKLLSFSEQELVDCDKLDEGCEGGLPDNAYRSIESLGGLELESEYPYEAEDEKCHFNNSEVIAKVVSAVNITSNETQMAQWLVENGPISVGINANAMQFYMGGVSHPLKFLCNPKELDHGVLIVGYGIHTYPIFKKKLPFWTIKNSWGPRWGEQGYYRVYRGDGTCGVNTMASSAIVA